LRGGLKEKEKKTRSGAPKKGVAHEGEKGSGLGRFLSWFKKRKKKKG